MLEAPTDVSVYPGVTTEIKKVKWDRCWQGTWWVVEGEMAEYEWISSSPHQDQPHSLSNTLAGELRSDLLLFTRDKGSVLAMSLEDTLTLR